MSYMCNECDDDVHRATYKCLDCNKWYCEPMACIHNQVPSQSTHKMVALSAYRNPTRENVENIPLYCQEHSKILDLYCITCEGTMEDPCFLCSYCVLFPPHRGHCFATAKTASQRLMQRLTNNILHHQKLFQQIELQLQLVRHRQNIISNLSHNIQNKLHEDCATLIHQIEEMRNQVLTLLTKVTSQKELQLAEIINNLELSRATQMNILTEKEAILKLFDDQRPSISEYQVLIRNMWHALSLSAPVTNDAVSQESISTVEYKDKGRKRKREDCEEQYGDENKENCFIVQPDESLVATNHPLLSTDWESIASVTIRYACNTKALCSSLQKSMSKHVQLLVENEDPVTIDYHVTGQGLEEYILPLTTDEAGHVRLLKEPYNPTSYAEISLHISIYSSRPINPNTHNSLDLLFFTIQDNQLVSIPVEHRFFTKKLSQMHDKHTDVYICEQQFIIHYRPKDINEVPAGDCFLELYLNGDKVTSTSNRKGRFSVVIKHATLPVFTLQDALDDNVQDTITALAALPSTGYSIPRNSFSLFATAASDCTVKLWQATTHATSIPVVTLRHVLVNHAYPVCSMIFSRYHYSNNNITDNNYTNNTNNNNGDNNNSYSLERLSDDDYEYLQNAILVSGDVAGHVLLWNVTTGTLLRRFVTRNETPSSHIAIINSPSHQDGINTITILSASNRHNCINVWELYDIFNNTKPNLRTGNMVVEGITKAVVTLPQRDASVILAVLTQTNDNLYHISFEIWRVFRGKKHKSIGCLEYPNTTKDTLLTTQLHIINGTDKLLSLVAADGILRIWNISIKSLVKSIHTRNVDVAICDTLNYPKVCSVTEKEVIITDGSRLCGFPLATSIENNNNTTTINNNNSTSKINNSVNNNFLKNSAHPITTKLMTKTWAILDNYHSHKEVRNHLDTAASSKDAIGNKTKINEVEHSESIAESHIATNNNCNQLEHERAIVLFPGLLISAVRDFKENEGPSFVQGWTIS